MGDRQREYVESFGNVGFEPGSEFRCRIVVLGDHLGEASFGFLVGLGVGLVLLIAVWIVDRLRTGK